jgi:hypothetical protein
METFIVRNSFCELALLTVQAHNWQLSACYQCAITGYRPLGTGGQGQEPAPDPGRLLGAAQGDQGIAVGDKRMDFGLDVAFTPEEFKRPAPLLNRFLQATGPG